MARKGSGRKNAKTDRISGLPDEVLAHILSFLYTKEAVQTCVLSKRWRNTRADMPVLEYELFNSTLDDPDGNRDEAARKSVARFERFVDGVLDNLERTNLDTVRYARFVDDDTTSLKISLSYPESKELKKQLEKDVPNCRGFINLKKLSIGTWNMSCDFYLVACLLKHSPNLKELTLYPEDFYWNQDNTQVEPREVIIGGVPFRHEYLETVRIFDGGSHKLSQRLMKTLIKTLRRYVNKIGNIVIFSFWSISDNAYQEWYLSDTD